MMDSKDGNEMEVKDIHHIAASLNHSFKGLRNSLRFNFKYPST